MPLVDLPSAYKTFQRVSSSFLQARALVVTASAQLLQIESMHSVLRWWSEQAGGRPSSLVVASSSQRIARLL